MRLRLAGKAALGPYEAAEDARLESEEGWRLQRVYGLLRSFAQPFKCP